MKEQLKACIDSRGELWSEMADAIFDYAEIGYQEFKSASLLSRYLAKEGFDVEEGVGGLETAFRAVYRKGEGGPSIGLLCEYDALENLGHACGHHLQGPAAVAAAVALKDTVLDTPFQVVVYGTPAEETTGGKMDMLEKGCFRDIDVALMFHAAPTTTTDIKCMALSPFKVVFHGKKSHAAIQPESGRSALDALLLMFSGIEFLREHVKEDTRMHYTILDAGGPDNVVPDQAVGSVSLRSYDRTYLDTVVERFKDIVKGASLMTGTTGEVIGERPFDSKIPVMKLNDLLMDNARLVHAPQMSPPREKTGSTDFGNVMFVVPGSCIRVAFVPPGTPSHSQEYLDAGKTPAAHQALLLAAKIMAFTAYDILSDSIVFEAIKEEFQRNKTKGF